MTIGRAEASFLIDERGRILQWPYAVAILLGVSAEAAVGRPCYDVVRGHDQFSRPRCGPLCPSLGALESGRLGASCRIVAHPAMGDRLWLTCSLAALPGLRPGALITLSEHPHVPRSGGGRTPEADSWGSSASTVGAVVKDLAALARLSVTLAPGSLEQTANRTLDWLRQATYAEAAELFLIGPDAAEIVLTAYQGPFRTAFSEISRFRPGEGFPGLVVSQGQPLATQNLPDDPRYLRTRVKEKGFHTYICVPLPGSRDIIGALGVASRHPKLDAERALRVLSWASRPVAAALEATLLRSRHIGLANGEEIPSQSEQSFEHFLQEKLRSILDAGSASGGALIVYGEHAPAIAWRVTEGNLARAMCPALRGSQLQECVALGQGQGPTSCTLIVENRPVLGGTARPPGSFVYCLPLVAHGHRIGIAQVVYDQRAPWPPTRHLAGLLWEASQAAEVIAHASTELQKYERAVSVLGRRRAEPDLQVAPSERLTAGPEQGAARSAPLHPVLDIRCLGEFQLYREGIPVTREMFPRRGALTLLKILLMLRGRPAPLDRLVEMLQLGTDPQAARATLHVLVHTLRRVLEPDLEGSGSTYIRRHGDQYYFSQDTPHRLDIPGFLESAALGERMERKGQASQAAAAYELAVDLYRGDLFEDNPYEDWCWEERETLRERYLGVLERLAGLCLDRGLPDRGITLYRKALKIDPLRESMHLGLIGAFLAKGQTAEALRQYEVCRDLLRRELGINPGPDIERLVHRIRNVSGI